MEDLVDNVNAYPISYSLYKELETGCDRAVPDTDSIVNVFKLFSVKQVKNKNRLQLKQKNYF
jgi:hypothetical protein